MLSIIIFLSTSDKIFSIESKEKSLINLLEENKNRLYVDYEKAKEVMKLYGCKDFYISEKEKKYILIK